MSKLILTSLLGDVGTLSLPSAQASTIFALRTSTWDELRPVLAGERLLHYWKRHGNRLTAKNSDTRLLVPRQATFARLTMRRSRSS